MRELEGRIAVVTGASSGIGAAIAERFARERMRVVVCARREDLLEEVAGRIRKSGAEALVCPLDVSDPAAIAACAGTVLSSYGRVDVVVANAGIGGGGKLLEMDDARMVRTVEVNLLGVARTMRAFLPAMLERGEGHIIATASVAGEIAGPTGTDYSMTKFGVLGLCEAARRELHGSGVSVSAILPGFIDTPLTHGHIPLRMPGPEIVAEGCVRLLRRPRPRLVVPGWYRPLIFLNRAMPRLADRLARRF